MTMDITIHNLFINEKNPCDEKGQNRSEKCNNIVKGLLKRSQRIKKQCELEQAIKECKEICLLLYRDGTVKIKTLSILYNNIETIEKLIKGLDRIGVVTEVPDRGYNYAIYDCSSNAEISVKLDEDTTKTILEQCKGILIKQLKEAADKL